MASIRFEWDPRKAAANVQKHGVSFAEAETAFYDDYAAILEDPDHSSDEERFLLLGMSSALRVLLVVHCVREAGSVIRLVSARRATDLSAPSVTRGGRDEDRARGPVPDVDQSVPPGLRRDWPSTDNEVASLAGEGRGLTNAEADSN